MWYSRSDMAMAKNREPNVGGKGVNQRGNTSPPAFPVAGPDPGIAPNQAEDLHSRYSRHVAKLDRFLAEAVPSRRSWKRDSAKDPATAKKN